MKQKKTLSYVVVILFPFLCVWTAAIATAFSFNPTTVFKDENFWGFSMLYYIVFAWIALYGVHLYWEEKEKG